VALHEHVVGFRQSDYWSPKQVSVATSKHTNTSWLSRHHHSNESCTIYKNKGGGALYSCGRLRLARSYQERKKRVLIWRSRCFWQKGSYFWTGANSRDVTFGFDSSVNKANGLDHHHGRTNLSNLGNTSRQDNDKLNRKQIGAPKDSESRRWT
jgi:hypothetical protein